MKKLLLIVMIMAMLVGVLTSCDMLPDEVLNIVDSITGNHEHKFDLVSEKAPTCIKAGSKNYECRCGETQTEELEALGHNLELTYYSEPTCYKGGQKKYKCTVCGTVTMENLTATGKHVFDESVEASRLVACTNSPCTAFYDRHFEGKYKETLTFSYTEADKDAFYVVFAELDAIIKAADAYDPEIHVYSEEGELYELYLIMEAKYEELYELLENIIGQCQLAQIEYHMEISNKDKETLYDEMSELRTTLVSDFYSFSDPIEKSMYRSFYYYGMTEAEIKAFVLESNAVADPVYKELTDSNTEIKLEFNALENPASGTAVLDLYAQLVENNNAIAELLGYENYLVYAYENVYDRDYSYTDVQQFREYVKTYIVPIYREISDKWNSLSGLTDADIEAYYSQVKYSFFRNTTANKYLNDYIDTVVFDANADKVISFSDVLNNLMMDGNLFMGEYEGAYVTSIYGDNIPVAYFGKGYQSPFTVAHEFGHYVNELYSEGKYAQSFDLLEMHSQGNEVLYLAYLKGQLGVGAFELCELYNMLVMLDTVVTALAVDTFEQAIYTDFYDGEGCEEIMADGTITKDEYDALFAAILEDFGTTGYTNSSYWRYVTISSPCYYISYSVSAISVLQLYPMAMEDMDSAIAAYSKLFTYVDEYETEDEYMTVEETLEYAGLYSFTDERLYKMIYKYFKG